MSSQPPARLRLNKPGCPRIDKLDHVPILSARHLDGQWPKGRIYGPNVQNFWTTKVTTMDVLTDVLESIRMRSHVYGRMELTAPWGLEFDFSQSGHSAFFMVSRGNCWLKVSDVDRPIPLASGDYVVLPRGQASSLQDHPTTPTVALQDVAAADRSTRAGSDQILLLRHGGSGVPTTLVAGCFSFEGEGSIPLISMLPSIIHIKADEGSPVRWMESTLQFLAAEAASPAPGTETIRNRLADILFIQAIRRHLMSKQSEMAGWLRALGDEQISRALQLIHESPSHAWTVDNLADGASMSRSAFADRFRRLVGIPPLGYVTRWRMHKASSMLCEGDATIASVARAVGYENEGSFGKVFKRYTGLAPGEFRSKRISTITRPS